MSGSLNFTDTVNCTSVDGSGSTIVTVARGAYSGPGTLALLWNRDAGGVSTFNMGFSAGGGTSTGLSGTITTTTTGEAPTTASSVFTPEAENIPIAVDPKNNSFKVSTSSEPAVFDGITGGDQNDSFLYENGSFPTSGTLTGSGSTSAKLQATCDVYRATPGSVLNVPAPGVLVNDTGSGLTAHVDHISFGVSSHPYSLKGNGALRVKVGSKRGVRTLEVAYHDTDSHGKSSNLALATVVVSKHQLDRSAAARILRDPHIRPGSVRLLHGTLCPYRTDDAFDPHTQCSRGRYVVLAISR